MRGIYTPVTKIRRQIFTEIAKFAINKDDAKELDKIPYKIIQGDVAHYRDSIFTERAIVGERIRLGLGLPLSNTGEYSQISEGFDEDKVGELKTELPLINVMKFACNRCEEKAVFVTNNCRGCLAHPCVSVCPVKAIEFVDGKSHINKDKCIRCGRCVNICPYSAIVMYDRPCAAACGVDAIESDEQGRAKINYDKCVSCGMCMVSCPFAAIADKSQIYQLIHSMDTKKEKVVAMIAPSFVGQFGPYATPDKVKEALVKIGFNDVVEVAVGADMGAVAEAHHVIDHVIGKDDFLATSCCPSWSVMTKNFFPDLKDSISSALSPMVATARLIKEERPDVKVTFIGPCAAKKLEALRKSVPSDVDFVITYEELMAIFVANNIEFADLEGVEPLADATKSGREYGAAGGVSEQIKANILAINPDLDIKIDRAEGLANCRKMLKVAQLGHRKGYLLEGMACPGGCVGGAGTLQPPVKAARELKKFADSADIKIAIDSDYVKQHVEDYKKQKE